jgi:hypothetical protein
MNSRLADGLASLKQHFFFYAPLRKLFNAHFSEAG